MRLVSLTFRRNVIWFKIVTYVNILTLGGIQRVVTTTNHKAPTLYATMYTIPNSWYRFNLEVMRTDTDWDQEKVSDIRVNGRSIGGCNPTGSSDCTFHDCSSNENLFGDHIADTILRSNDKGIMKFEFEYSREHDMKFNCPYNGGTVQAAASISLDPIEGKSFQ